MDEASERRARRLALAQWSSPGRTLAALVLGTVLLGVCIFGTPAPPMDEGQLVAYPDLVLRGALPNRDFEHTYGPGNLWVLSLAFRILGPSLTTERLVGLGYHLTLVLAVYAFGRRWTTPGVAAACGGVCLLLLQPLGIAAFASLGGVALATWALHEGCLAANAETGRDAVRRWLVSGALTAIALSVRPDLAPALGVAVLSLQRFSTWRGRAAFAAGAALSALPFALHVARLGLSRALEALVSEPLLATPGRYLPLPPRSLGDLTELLLVFAALVGLFFLVVRRGGRDMAAGRRGVVACVASFSSLLVLQLLRRADAWHIHTVAAVVVPLAVASALMDPRWTLLPGRAPALLFAGTIALSAEAIQELACNLAAVAHRPPSVARAGRVYTMNRENEAADLQSIVDLLSSKSVAGQSLFVGPRDLRRSNYNDTFIYYLFPDLQPASYFTEMNPGVANRVGSRLASDLKRADWLILTPRFDAWAEPNASAIPGSSEPLAVVDALFCLVSEQPTFALFARCPKPSE